MNEVLEQCEFPVSSFSMIYRAKGIFNLLDGHWDVLGKVRRRTSNKTGGNSLEEIIKMNLIIMI